MDVISVGEMLIDFTMQGRNEQGKPILMCVIPEVPRPMQ